MSGLPKQQDHVEHFCATKSWTATNSETVQSRSLTAKPLILHSTMRTLRRKLQSLPAREMEKPAIYRNTQKPLKFARQTKIHQQKCHARRKPHTWRKWSGRVGGESGRVGEESGRVGGRLPVYKEAKTGESGERYYIYACVCACIMTIEGCATV